MSAKINTPGPSRTCLSASIVSYLPIKISIDEFSIFFLIKPNSYKLSYIFNMAFRCCWTGSLPGQGIPAACGWQTHQGIRKECPGWTKGETQIQSI
jgi:hypothetical protein